MNNHQIINGFEIDEISKIFSLLLNHRRRNTEERQQTVEKKHKEMSNVNWRSEPDWKKKRQQRSNRWTFSLFFILFYYYFFFHFFSILFFVQWKCLPSLFPLPRSRLFDLFFPAFWMFPLKLLRPEIDVVFKSNLRFDQCYFRNEPFADWTLHFLFAIIKMNGKFRPLLNDIAHDQHHSVTCQNIFT